MLGVFVRAQTSDEPKKKTAQEEMRAVTSPTPSEKATPKPTPKPAKRKSKSKKKATPTPTAKPKPKKTPADEEEDEASPTPKSKKSPAQKSGEDEETTPKPKKSPAKKSVEDDEEVTPKAKASATASPKKKSEKQEATPKPTEKAIPAKSPSPAPAIAKPETPRPPVEASAVPRPAPRPSPRAPPSTSLPSDITVEKSGLEQEQGFEPAPPPPPVKRSFWPFSRQPANYKYLTAANIEAIRRAPVQRARWKFVIVHNSGTRQGSARVFDYYHRRVRRMKNGLAYHFVIGNGTSTRNGQIEIGDRWIKQIRGGHVHSDYMNNMGLGICLVGDFNRDQPTRAQLEACEELIKYLHERCGKMQVRPHREVNPPRWATDCPGDVFPYGWFGRFR